MPGWFKRRRAAANLEQDYGAAVGDTGGNGTTGSTTASTTTGGSLSQEPVVVWEAAHLMEAQVVKGRLESEGIPAFIRSEAAGVIYGITAGNLARADVLVPAALADKAVDILFAEESLDDDTGDQTGASAEET
jgi:hypothetical protein